ncbi:hypothetical protein Tco_0093370 [Tanacetum coccineum]
MESIEKCIVERALHEQEIQKRLKRLNHRKLQIQECKVQEVKALDASSRTQKAKDQSLGNQSNTSGNECNISGIGSSRLRNECSERYNLRNDTDICPSYDTEPMAEAPNFADYIVYESYARNVDQHATKHENERVLLASSILKLKADIEQQRNSK